MSRLLRRLSALGGAATLLAAMLVGIAPASACGCGGFVGPDGASVAVNREVAAISWDGTKETVLMSMNTLTRDEDVALLIPTPAPASVARAGADVFDELDAVTAPVQKVEYSWWGENPFGSGASGGAPEAGATQAPVTVLDTVQLGELEVTTLAASDATALADWLKAHGYVMRDGLAQAVLPYITDGWYYAAVRLRPEVATTLSGEMQPLALTFDTSQMIYPMRLSAAATSTQEVRTYVFGPHRMERTDAQAETSSLRYAGAVTPADFSDPQLAGFAKAGFLTASEQEFWDPANQIVADFTFAPAAKDTEFRLEYTVTRTRMLLGAPAGFTLIAFGGAAAVLGGIALFVANRRRPLVRPAGAAPAASAPR